jgi:hypothetical protein
MNIQGTIKTKRHTFTAKVVFPLCVSIDCWDWRNNHYKNLVRIALEIPKPSWIP